MRNNLEAALPDRKRKDLLNELRQILQKNSLTPAHAAKIRGRPGFSQSLLFGRVGRALLTPFTCRQYSKLNVKFRPLNDEIRDVIPRWIKMLENGTPRQILFNPPRPTLVYVDASGPGHVGAHAFYDDTSKMAHTHLPQWLVGSGEIFEFEMAGALFGLAFACLLTPGRPIVLCIDNTAASSALIRGNCSTPSGREFASAFWLMAAHYAVPIWIEQVKSELNIADGPSRICECLEEPAAAKVPNREVPENSKRMFETQESISKDKYSFSDGARNLTEVRPCPKTKYAESQFYRFHSPERGKLNTFTRGKGELFKVSPPDPPIEGRDLMIREHMWVETDHNGMPVFHMERECETYTSGRWRSRWSGSSSCHSFDERMEFDCDTEPEWGD